MKKRRFADGGTSALDDLASGQSKGRFDEDVYARAKRFLENKEESKPAKPASVKPVAAKNPKPPAPERARSESADEPARGPTPEQLAEFERLKAVDKPLEGVYPESWLIGGGVLRSIANAIGKPLARAAAEGWRAGRPGVTTAKELAKGPADEALEKAASAIASRPTAAQAARDASRFTAQQEREAAESAMRGATNRRLLRERMNEAGRGRAAAMEENKPILQARQQRSSPRSLVREEEPDFAMARGGKAKGYAKGGSIRGGGCEKRGKTRGKFV